MIKNVSKKEFLKVRTNLLSIGFSRSNLAKIEMLFYGHMNEEGRYAGIDESEIKSTIDWMKKNKSSHGLSLQQIQILENELAKKI